MVRLPLLTCVDRVQAYLNSLGLQAFAAGWPGSPAELPQRQAWLGGSLRNGPQNGLQPRFDSCSCEGSPGTLALNYRAITGPSRAIKHPEYRAIDRRSTGANLDSICGGESTGAGQNARGRTKTWAAHGQWAQAPPLVQVARAHWLSVARPSGAVGRPLAECGSGAAGAPEPLLARTRGPGG